MNLKNFHGPIQFDYGCFTSIGTNSYANFNFTCVDCCPVTIGENVFLGPNVSLLTPIHPLRWQERNQYVKQDGTPTDTEYAKPITIGNNCWIAGNVTICGGVTIGAGCVIDAGSVVTKPHHNWNSEETAYMLTSASIHYNAVTPPLDKQQLVN